MSIQTIVEQALKEGFLTPMMEGEVGRLCESAAEMSLEEYMSLDRLMGALLSGEVVAIPRKQFINIMEELVVSEAITRVSQTQTQKDCAFDVGDIAAYALNRLPPLYATTEEGANYQRQRAKQELQDLIGQRVEEGIQRYLARPESIGQPLEEHKGILEQLIGRLNTKTTEGG